MGPTVCAVAGGPCGCCVVVDVVTVVVGDGAMVTTSVHVDDGGKDDVGGGTRVGCGRAAGRVREVRK